MGLQDRLRQGCRSRAAGTYSPRVLQPHPGYANPDRQLRPWTWLSVRGNQEYRCLLAGYRSTRAARRLYQFMTRAMVKLMLRYTAMVMAITSMA